MNKYQNSVSIYIYLNVGIITFCRLINQHVIFLFELF